MPRVVFFKDGDGTTPVLDWFGHMPDIASDKCVARIERLKELGHGLRRPEADYLRDGIYELRAQYQKVNYRILYFFAGQVAIVLAHGITKEKEVPPREIQIALNRRAQYLKDPERHTA